MSQIETRPDQPSSPRAPDWKLLSVLAIPLACCALPAILASAAAVGVLAWTVGLGAATALAASVVVVLIFRRRSKACDMSDRPETTTGERP